MKNTILWDFDGVIIDSMKVREQGFIEIFKSYPTEQLDELILFHRNNGGLSRYVKIRYFFERILKSNYSEADVERYANNFSKIMRSRLTDPSNLIKDSVSFIIKNHQKFNFHIVSGSDQDELRFLCDKLGLTNFFISIYGSPTPKNELINTLLKKFNYNISTTCLIGDSINDFDAANYNQIKFYGYNNKQFECNSNYIESFSTCKFKFCG